MTGEEGVAHLWSPEIVGGARDLGPDSLLNPSKAEQVAQETGEAKRVEVVCQMHLVQWCQDFILVWSSFLRVVSPRLPSLCQDGD